MAGICGTLDVRRGLQPGEPAVRAMLGRLAHRGPDGERVVAEPPVTLGGAVHAFLDGPDPALGDGELRLVLDGDLLGVPELAAALRARGRAPVGEGQAAVLLAAWREWGPACLDRLEGSFAFALWDGRARRLHLVRDRLALRPLYYATAAGRLRFASEIGALFADGDVSRAPDDERVLLYLAHNIADHDDRTFVQAVRQVPVGGHVVVSPERGVETAERWYLPRPAPAEGEPAERFLALFEDAVALRLRGGGVVGATLSGGVDSSSVLATAALLRRRAGEEPVPAVVARTADPRLDEWPYARLLVERYGIPVVEVWPDEHGLVDDLDAFLLALDGPCHSPSVYGHWRVMRAVREAGIDVVLEGQMGERFGGVGEWFPQLLYDVLRRGRAGVAVHQLVARRRTEAWPATRSLLDLAKLLVPRGVRARHAARPPWLRPGLAVEPPPLPRRGWPALQLHQLTVSDVPLIGREVDRDAATFGLVERAPFQDTRVFEYALSLPPERLHRDGRGKAPVLEAMRGRVPDEILDRPTKQGFTVDASLWLQGALGDEIARCFRGEAAASRPWWDAAAVLHRLEAARQGTAPGSELWRAYSVERWFELVAEREPARTRS